MSTLLRLPGVRVHSVSGLGWEDVGPGTGVACPESLLIESSVQVPSVL
jgi:hypothetical protein